jgi:hypothetical protein
MVTLAITKELIAECHRELAYFTNAAAAVIQTGLVSAGRGGANGSRDLEISSRAASTFYAFAVHIDSAAASTDNDTRRAYSNLLVQFSRLARERLIDADTETKARLIGLGAFAGAISSDAFYNSAYQEQISCVLPAMLDNLDASAYSNEAPMMKEEAIKVAESGVASNAEYSAKRRNAAIRSIPSFTFDSEKGVSYKDVASSAMGNLYAILHNGDGSNVRIAVNVFIDYLNGRQGTPRQWENKDWCCWITESLCSWTALQYRFIFLTQLVEHLVDESEGPAQDKHFTLIAMINTLLASKLSMIGLSTSDTANNLLGYAVRRVHFAENDVLVVPLVYCISALATHVYYADQLNDMAEEISARIAALEVPESQEGENGAVTTYMDRLPARDSIRMLLACLVGLMQVSHKSSGEVQGSVQGKGAKNVALIQSGARNRISTSAWHQTASLLASPDYMVRQAYEEALLTFFTSEVTPVTIDKTDPLSDSLGSKLSVEATGFSHAFSSALYVLVLSKVLYAPQTVKESPLEALSVIDRSNRDQGRTLESNDPTASALPVDVTAVIQILETMYERISIASLLGTVPALLAINNASNRLPAHRKEAVRTLLSRALTKIGTIWGVSSLKYSASSEYLPNFPAPPGSKPLLFADDDVVESSKSSAINMNGVIDSLSSNAKIQKATGLDAKALRAWFGRDWTVQIAVDDSFVGASPFTTGDDDIVTSSRFNGIADRAIDVAQIPEANGVVGVDDFRQALGTGQRRMPSIDANGEVNGYSTAASDAAERRSSRRASRKESQGMNFSNSGGIGGLLDSLKVGVTSTEEEEVGLIPQQTKPPYVA